MPFVLAILSNLFELPRIIRTIQAIVYLGQLISILLDSPNNEGRWASLTLFPATGESRLTFWDKFCFSLDFIVP